ncbi:MAG: hypothetical protein ABIV47_14235, partial [Roseiflexaceae bacterium]
GVTESSASCQIAHQNQRKRLDQRGRTAVFGGSFLIFVSLTGRKQRYLACSAMIKRHVRHRAGKSVTPLYFTPLALGRLG